MLNVYKLKHKKFIQNKKDQPHMISSSKKQTAITVAYTFFRQRFHLMEIYIPRKKQ